MKKTVLIIFLSGIVFSSHVRASGEPGGFFTTENSETKKGNTLLAEKNLAEAYKYFEEAAKKLPGRHAVHLNRAIALIRMGKEKYTEAMQALTLAASPLAPDNVRARAHALLGFTYNQMEDYEEAYKNLKNSLMISPGNKDVAWNMEITAKKIKEKQEKEKENKENKDENKDGDDKDDEKKDNKDGDNKDDESKDKKDGEDKKNKDKKDNKNKDKKEGENKKNKQDKNKKDKDNGKKEKKDEAKQNIEQLLNSLDDTPRNLIKEMNRLRHGVRPVGKTKDW